jgi:hypothetical protein
LIHCWKTTPLDSENDIFDLLTELRAKRWLGRGQSKPYGNLMPTIDRPPFDNVPRREKLILERQSIDIFRSTARFFSDAGERNAVSSDIGALMVLRHYGVRTRLLDWSSRPEVAAYFAVDDEANDAVHGELWDLTNDCMSKRDTRNGDSILTQLLTAAEIRIGSTPQFRPPLRFQNHHHGFFAGSTLKDFLAKCLRVEPTLSRRALDMITPTPSRTFWVIRPTFISTKSLLLLKAGFEPHSEKSTAFGEAPCFRIQLVPLQRQVVSSPCNTVATSGNQPSKTAKPGKPAGLSFLKSMSRAGFELATAAYGFWDRQCSHFIIRT